jgi:hypothetical protein
MINKKLEKLLEEAIAKKQALKESELGSAAAEPVHTEEKPEEHTPEMENKDVFPADEHEQSEEVEAPVIESYTREDLEELFEALELDTHKYTFEYLAEELGFTELNEGKIKSAIIGGVGGSILALATFFNKNNDINAVKNFIERNSEIVQNLSDEEMAQLQRISPPVADIVIDARENLSIYDRDVFDPAKSEYDSQRQGIEGLKKSEDEIVSANTTNINNLKNSIIDSGVDLQKIAQIRKVAQWEEDQMEKNIKNYHSPGMLSQSQVDSHPDIFTHDIKGNHFNSGKFDFTNFDINKFVEDGYKFTNNNKLYISNNNPYIDADKYYDAGKTFGIKVHDGDEFDNDDLSAFRDSLKSNYNADPELQNHPDYKVYKQNLDNSADKSKTYKTQIDNLDTSFEKNRDSKLQDLERNVDDDISQNLKKQSNKAAMTSAALGIGGAGLIGVGANLLNRNHKKDDKELSESYTREDLEELFEALELDTHKYTFEYLAEELGFAPEGEMEQAPAMVAVQPEPDQGEYDEEGSMAKLQIHTIADASAELYNMLGDNDNLPEWVQSKITLAKEYIDTARDYMKSQSMEQAQQTELVPVEEPQPVHSQPEVEEESLQERYVLKRPKGRPSNKSKAMDAKGSSEMNEKGEVVYTRSK